ncbi:hypothetical protein [Yinghuangia seranimata]|uniref:hypothetical protein n=1 Tax=Yinghuangia seranimata TaxID=408067 RepID=UPI00248BBC37|nr:hypothetical protein [Yinghuangia seranimata]MDI2127774.1 hypothetical protein [Yinghuangia seranimata]
MSSIALDIRDHPELAADGPEDDEDQTGPVDADRASGNRGRPSGIVPPPGRAPDDDHAATVPVRLRCPDCGTVLTSDQGDEPPWDSADPYLDDAPVVPVHAAGPDPTDPFGIAVCAGSGRAADPDKDTVAPPQPAPATPPRTVLPAGLDWRAQPFSHIEA